MHIAVVVRIGGESTAAEAALERFSSFVSSHPHVPLSFTLDLEAAKAADRRPDLVDGLQGTAHYIRTCLGSPDPNLMPSGVLERSLQLESDVVGRLGFESDVLLTTQPWPSHLLPRLVRNGIRGLLVPATALTAPGVLTHLDAVLPAMPFAETITAPRGDGLHAVLVTVDHLLSAVEAIPLGCATSPSEFFATHATVGQAIVDPPSPDRDFDEELLARKTIRLSTRIVDRTADEVIEQLIATASVLGNPPPSEQRTDALLSAHERLIHARSMMDHTRRRGDDWVKASRIDWNADGSEDVHVELPRFSLVLDPAAGGSILVLDDKDHEKALGTLIDGPLGSLLKHQLVEGEDLVSGTFELVSIEEARERLAVSMRGSIAGGNVTCRLAMTGLRLDLEYAVEGVSPGRLGPQLALALASPRMRVDGGEWRPIVEEPIAVEGHRFRLAGSDDRMVLLSTMTPGEAFVRPAVGGTLVWMHWLTGGEGSYAARIDLDA